MKIKMKNSRNQFMHRNNAKVLVLGSRIYVFQSVVAEWELLACGALAITSIPMHNKSRIITPSVQRVEEFKEMTGQKYVSFRLDIDLKMVALK